MSLKWINIFKKKKSMKERNREVDSAIDFLLRQEKNSVMNVTVTSGTKTMNVDSDTKTMNVTPDTKTMNADSDTKRRNEFLEGVFADSYPDIAKWASEGKM